MFRFFKNYFLRWFNIERTVFLVHFSPLTLILTRVICFYIIIANSLSVRSTTHYQLFRFFKNYFLHWFNIERTVFLVHFSPWTLILTRVICFYIIIANSLSVRSTTHYQLFRYCSDFSKPIFCRSLTWNEVYL